MASLATLALLLASCGPPAPESGMGVPYAGIARDLEIVTGQIVFVPAYTELRRGRETVGLQTAVAIHNTDLENVIIIESVRHHDTSGKLVREYVEQPIELQPVGTLMFTAPPTSRGVGLGANFIVRWGAETAVHEPVIEAVMIGATGSFSLLSPGRVISQTTP